MTNILIGLVGLYVGRLLKESMEYLGGLLLISYILCLGFRDIALSFYLAYRDGDHVIRKVPQMGTWKLGTSIVVIIVISAIAVFFNGA
jgi:hypothetical protein